MVISGIKSPPDYISQANMFTFYLLILTVTPVLMCTLPPPVESPQEGPESCGTLYADREEDVVNRDVLSAFNETYEPYLEFCCPDVRNIRADDGQWIMRRSEMDYANETADIVDQLASALDLAYGTTNKVLFACFVRANPITVCIEQKQTCTPQKIVCNLKTVDQSQNCSLY